MIPNIQHSGRGKTTETAKRLGVQGLRKEQVEQIFFRQ